jgi:uncharacterized protein YcbX
VPATLAHIWRHPVKGIGAEPLTAAALSPAGALHGDRAWALLNAEAQDSDAWQPRRNFLQVASGPALAAVTARTEGRAIVLSHPDRPDLTLEPEAAPGALGDWAAPLWPADRPGPARLVRAPGHGMTDMPDPYVSLGSLASLAALSARAGVALDMRRFRINLWLDGLAPWEEAEWVGRRFHLGAVLLEGAEPIGRCRAPEANPATGRRDVNVLALLEAARQDTIFGLYARVIEGGEVARGDRVGPA